uniref:FHA domain-containing protein n=1 Tax=Globodera rostochiensis TaxID=31243 RepID=A0A914HAM8_GLORO
MASEKDLFPLPSWLARPPKGSHLDVLKGEKLMQKLLIDEKGHYYFGRNPSDCDFLSEHASCSRVHAVLLYHKLLKRFALVDLESSHGTFVDNVKIPALSPVFLNTDQSFHFGASTRKYYLGEKSLSSSGAGDEMDEDFELENSFSLAQSDLDNVTELNTANNRRIPTISQTLSEARLKLRQRPNVKFNEEEEVINPEEVDPNVGRFRNMVRTAVIPMSNTHRRQRDVEDQLFDFYTPSEPKKKKVPSTASPAGARLSASGCRPGSITLGSLSLNAAPDLELYSPALPSLAAAKIASQATKYGPSPAKSSSRQLLGVVGESVGGAPLAAEAEECPLKKKYAKEAWPADMRRRSGSIL